MTLPGYDRWLEPPDGEDDAECPRCDGTKIEYDRRGKPIMGEPGEPPEPCHTCKGTGMVPFEELSEVRQQRVLQQRKHERQQAAQRARYPKKASMQLAQQQRLLLIASAVEKLAEPVPFDTSRLVAKARKGLDQMHKNVHREIDGGDVEAIRGHTVDYQAVAKICLLLSAGEVVKAYNFATKQDTYVRDFLPMNEMAKAVEEYKKWKRGERGASSGPEGAHNKGYQSPLATDPEKVLHFWARLTRKDGRLAHQHLMTIKCLPDGDEMGLKALAKRIYKMLPSLPAPPIRGKQAFIEYIKNNHWKLSPEHIRLFESELVD